MPDAGTAGGSSRLVVLDTSVVVAWFFEDALLRPAALALRSELRDEPARFVVPHLLHSELIHVLARKSAGDEQFVAKALALFLAFGVRTLALSERALGRMAHWACSGLSGYDATFVALAEDIGGQWLTADTRAAQLAGPQLARDLAVAYG